MKIIIDTNIVFSCLLNTNGTIGELFFHSHEGVQLYSCAYMQYEIRKHWNRLLSISGLSEDELSAAYQLMVSRIQFIAEELIPAKAWKDAEALVAGVDPNDIDFVALTIYLNGILWTGDKVLHKGLRLKNFESVCTTQELSAFLNQ